MTKVIVQKSVNCKWIVLFGWWWCSSRFFVDYCYRMDFVVGAVVLVIVGLKSNILSKHVMNGFVWPNLFPKRKKKCRINFEF